MQKIIRQLREMKCFARSTAPSCYIVLGCFSNVIFFGFLALDYAEQVVHQKKSENKIWIGFNKRLRQWMAMGFKDKDGTFQAFASRQTHLH